MVEESRKRKEEREREGRNRRQNKGPDLRQMGSQVSGSGVWWECHAPHSSAQS